MTMIHVMAVIGITEFSKKLIGDSILLEVSIEDNKEMTAQILFHLVPRDGMEPVHLGKMFWRLRI